MPFIIGVDMVERSNRTKARKKRMVNGVAGRSIVRVVLGHGGDEDEVRGCYLRVTV